MQIDPHIINAARAGESSPVSFFASKSITAHLLRGFSAVGLLIFAYQLGDTEPILSIIAGISALVMLRGCPMCWTVGLVETIRQRLRKDIL